MSLPEVLLWTRLRKQFAGVRFRRQHPVGRYILDFYCPSARVAVEIDGWGHNLGDQPARDERRDVWLATQGVRVLRIPADQVLSDIEGALDQIVGALQPPQSGL